LQDYGRIAAMTTLDARTTTQEFPAGAFRQIGWAFLFLGISVGPIIRLGDEGFLIDLLPDFIGYLMITTAANQLVPLHRRARPIRNLALLLTYLSLPMTVHYGVLTSRSGNVTTWYAPFWPLWLLGMVVVVLELVLVWMLCGLVADLARRAGDSTTESRARGLRVIYILIEMLRTGGVVLLLMSRSPALIIGGVVGGVVIGLTLLGLMMGLMRRAERIGEECPELVLPVTVPAEQKCAGGGLYRLLVCCGILLPIALAVGAFWYYSQWQEAREVEERKASSSAYFSPARDAFYAYLRAGQIDDAYACTTADFKSRMNRDQLAELARHYVAYVNRPERDRGPSGAGTSSSVDYVSEYEYAEVAKGRIVQVSITIRHDRDSIFLPKPPPLRVDDFKVEERPAQQGPWPAFGNPAGTNR
jgi:hypothetical protein